MTPAPYRIIDRPDNNGVMWFVCQAWSGKLPFFKGHYFDLSAGFKNGIETTTPVAAFLIWAEAEDYLRRVIAAKGLKKESQVVALFDAEGRPC